MSGLRQAATELACTLESRPHFVLVVTAREVRPGVLDLDASAVSAAIDQVTGRGNTMLDQLSARLQAALLDIAEDMGFVASRKPG